MGTPGAIVEKRKIVTAETACAYCEQVLCRNARRVRRNLPANHLHMDLHTTKGALQLGGCSFQRGLRPSASASADAAVRRNDGHDSRHRSPRPRPLIQTKTTKFPLQNPPQPQKMSMRYLSSPWQRRAFHSTLCTTLRTPPSSQSRAPPSVRRAVSPRALRTSHGPRTRSTATTLETSCARDCIRS